MTTATPTSTSAAPLNGSQRGWLKKMGAVLGTPASSAVTSSSPAPSDTVGATPADLIMQWGPEVLALLKTLGARRKCLVAVVNATEDRVVFRGKEKFKSGGFATIPKEDKIVPKGGKMEFVAASPENNPIGEIEGEIPFGIDLETNWHVRFSNPRVGAVKASNDIDDTVAASKFFADDPLFGNGDTAEFRFTLRGAGGGTPPNPNPNPNPSPTPTPGPTKTDIASSCLITITNNSKAVLSLLDPKQVVGNFMTQPPNSIAPGATATVVYVETPNNKDPNDEGCKGGVLWEVGSPKICTCLMEWDNPEGKQNTVNVTFAPDGTGFRCIKEIGQGDENVPVSFTFSGEGGGPTPPPTTSGKLKFTVVDGETNKPIEGASIQVEQQSAKSDSAGKAEVGTTSGKHAFHVTADGFQANDGNATLNDGADTEVSVAMQKGQPQPKPDFKEPVESKQPTLRPGDNSADGWVEFMQSLLIKQLGDSVKQEINGNFDAQTEKNVRKFQGDHKPKPLQVDGVVGNQTWAALRKAPDEAVGTDGRKPHSFVEQGPEARWVCEQTNFEIKIDPVKDTVTMSLASVGTEPVDKFEATIFVTPEGGTKTQLPPITIGPATTKRDTGSGDIHQVILHDFAKTFGTGTHTIQGFLPQDLGGDKFEDKVTVNKPGATGAVVVTVSNKTTGKPIENATVDINGIKEQTTSSGLVNIDGIPAGTRPFKVTANGFQDESGTVEVPGDDNAPAVTLKLAMKTAQGPPSNKPAYEPGEREASFTSPGGAETTNSGFVLFNFGVNQNTLKPEHQKFLTDQINALQMDQANPQKFVSIIAGFTDDVDEEAKNSPLRDQRAAAVQKFLLDQGVAPESAGVIRKTAAGQFLAKNTTRDGRSRNRAVTIDLAFDIIPPIPDPPKPKTTKATKWALQSNLSASIPTKPGVAISTLNFILHNRETKQKFLLQFAGFGAGFGLSFPGSVSFPAPTDFETTEPVDETAFNGGGEIHQVSIGVGVIGFSEGQATLHPNTNPKQIDISGFQFSFGADASFIGGFWKILG